MTMDVLELMQTGTGLLSKDEISETAVWNLLRFFFLHSCISAFEHKRFLIPNNLVNHYQERLKATTKSNIKIVIFKNFCSSFESYPFQVTG